jgi:hypothetical protein
MVFLNTTYPLESLNTCLDSAVTVVSSQLFTGASFVMYVWDQQVHSSLRCNENRYACKEVCKELVSVEGSSTSVAHRSTHIEHAEAARLDGVWTCCTLYPVTFSSRPMFTLKKE